MVDEAPLLTAKAHIAVALKTPASGNQELDHMIMSAVYRDVALTALQAIIAKAPAHSSEPGADDICKAAVRGAFDYADAFLDHLAGFDDEE